MKRIILPIIILFLSLNYVHSAKFTLKWVKNPLFVKYFIEVSDKKDFSGKKQIFSTENAYYELDLDIGVHFIRIQGFDKDNVKSKYSPIRKIIIRYKNYYNPFLKSEGVFIVPQVFKLDFLQKKEPQKTLYYKIDDDTFIQYKNEALSLSPDKDHKIQYTFSNKKSKNIKTITIKVDITPPKYKIIVEKKELTDIKEIKVKHNTDLIIKGIDDISGVKEILYSYDKEIFYRTQDNNPIKKIQIKIKKKKPFTLYFKLIDNVGNVTPLHEIKVIPIL